MTLHQVYISLHTLDNLDYELFLEWSFYVYEGISPDLVDINYMGEIQVGRQVGHYLGSVGVDLVSNLLGGRASVLDIELDSEVLIRSSRIMACS